MTEPNPKSLQAAVPVQFTILSPEQVTKMVDGLSNRHLVEAELSFVFEVGQFEGDEENSHYHRQLNSYRALEKILADRGPSELGVVSPEIEPAIQRVSVELSPCKWNGIVWGEKLTYDVGFISHSAFSLPVATLLRNWAMEAYSQGCGKDAQFIRAVLRETWAHDTYSAYPV